MRAVEAGPQKHESEPMNITLRQIEAFLAVADLGSFTQAADRLGVTQPALSLLVRELEEQLGLRLLDRTTRRTQVSQGAVDFEYAIRNAVSQFDLVIKSATDLASLREGRVVIAAPPTFSAVTMPPAIAEFRAMHPGVEVVLIDTSQAIEELVAKGLADLGLGTFSSDEAEVDRTILMKDPLRVVTSQRPPFSEMREIKWAELATQPIIGLTRESGIRRLVDHWSSSLGIELRYSFSVQSINTALSMVNSNLGIAILPSYAMALKGERNIQTLELTHPVVEREISLIKRRGRSSSPAAVKFSQVVRKWVRNQFPSASAEDNLDQGET